MTSRNRLKEAIWNRSPRSLRAIYQGLVPNTVSATPFEPLDETIEKLIKERAAEQEEILVLDVGANVGQSVIRFSRLLENVIFHTFEPIESCHSILVNQFQGPSFVHNRIALSNENGTRKFYEFRKSDTSSFLRPDLKSDWARRRAERYADGNVDDLIADEYEINTMTLDSYLSSQKQLAKRRVALLKMDTQGHEPEVLGGSTELLSDSARRPLLIESEVILGAMYEKHSNFYDIEQHLVPHGYRLVALSGGGNLINKPSLGINALYASPEIASKIPH